METETVSAFYNNTKGRPKNQIPGTQRDIWRIRDTRWKPGNPPSDLSQHSKEADHQRFESRRAEDSDADRKRCRMKEGGGEEERRHDSWQGEPECVPASGRPSSSSSSSHWWPHWQPLHQHLEGLGERQIICSILQETKSHGGLGLEAGGQQMTH